MKKVLAKALLLAMVLTLIGGTTLISGAAAEGEKTYTEWKDQLFSVKSFKFQRHKNGLQRGDVPVFTAPYDNAYRFANNRQACDTNEALYEGGYTEDGWLLVRYETGNGNTRVGYVPGRYVKGFKSGMSAKGFGQISAVAADTIEVTDNPLKGGQTFTELNTGDEFTILGKYTYHENWWYIECTMEGKPCRGFIDRDIASFYPGTDVADNMNQTPVTLSTLGVPDKAPTGEEMTGMLVVKGSKGDERKMVHREADSDSQWITVVYPTMQYPCYGTKTGKDGKPWHYVYVEQDSTWGWCYGDFFAEAN